MSVRVNRVYVVHGVKVLAGLVGTIGFSRVHGVQGLGVTRFTRFRVHGAAKDGTEKCHQGVPGFTISGLPLLDIVPGMPV